MLSRVANSIYWMGRYVERAESTARFLGVIHHLALDLPEALPNPWYALVAASGDADAFDKRYNAPDQANVTHYLTTDPDNPNAIYNCLYKARENARSVRETISSEMWEQLNRSFLMVKDAQSANRIEQEPSAFYSHFKKACHLFTGLTDATMTHGEPWHFARAGRLIERADKTSRIIDVKYFLLLPNVRYVGTPYDSLLWAALLKCISAFEMYRKQYHHLKPNDVVCFLALDRLFPRSLRYCVTKAEESLRAISGSPWQSYANDADRRIGMLRAQLDFACVDDIFANGLHEYMDQFQKDLNTAGKAISDTFFITAPQPGQLQPDGDLGEAPA